jgi:hypothetical protein
MKNKYIVITDKDKKEIFYKIIDVAKKYNFTPQYISNILRGKTKHKFFIYKENLIFLEYFDMNEEEIKKIKEIAIEKKKEHNKKNYEKYKLNNTLSKEQKI